MALKIIAKVSVILITSVSTKVGHKFLDEELMRHLVSASFVLHVALTSGGLRFCLT